MLSDSLFSSSKEQQQPQEVEDEVQETSPKESEKEGEAEQQTEKQKQGNEGTSSSTITHVSPKRKQHVEISASEASKLSAFRELLSECNHSPFNKCQPMFHVITMLQEAAGVCERKLGRTLKVCGNEYPEICDIISMFHRGFAVLYKNLQPDSPAQLYSNMDDYMQI